MEPLKDLVAGLEIIQPFLSQHCFEFEKYESDKSSGGQFTIATFKNGRKQFIIGFRFSIGKLIYQFDQYKVGHTFYLDHLGHSDQRQFPGFQSEDKLLGFRNVLHDLYLLVNDFFDGPYDKLVEAAKLQDEFIKENNKNARLDYTNHFDQRIIEAARIKFKEKDFKGTLDLYKTIEHTTLLKDLDKKTIEYCTKHIGENSTGESKNLLKALQMWWKKNFTS